MSFQDLINSHYQFSFNGEREPLAFQSTSSHGSGTKCIAGLSKPANQHYITRRFNTIHTLIRKLLSSPDYLQTMEPPEYSE